MVRPSVNILPLNDTSRPAPINNREFDVTSPPIIERPATYKRALAETSLETKRRREIDKSTTSVNLPATNRLLLNDASAPTNNCEFIAMSPE